MNLIQLLDQREVEILNQAANALMREHLNHYDEAGREQNKMQLQILYDLMAHCIKERDLTAMIRYVEDLAQKRYVAGFDLREVQTAFNVLEEVIWKQIIQECSPSELGEALGLVSTVHGAAKDALASQYVSLASKTKPASLNLSALFKGTDGL
jgi:hypothetical protein